MTVRLLTEHHLEFLSLTGDCTGLSESTLSCQNAILLEITCRGSMFIWFRNQTGSVSVTSIDTVEKTGKFGWNLTNITNVDVATG